MFGQLVKLAIRPAVLSALPPSTCFVQGCYHYIYPGRLKVLICEGLRHVESKHSGQYFLQPLVKKSENVTIKDSKQGCSIGPST